ncbi:MAG: hypothetical protein ACR2HX_09710 [Pyrinomonadaceae bacterium]
MSILRAGVVAAQPFLIVEQKVRGVLTIANRVYVLRNGRVSFSGSATELSDDAELHEVHL